MGRWTIILCRFLTHTSRNWWRNGLKQADKIEGIKWSQPYLIQRMCLQWKWLISICFFYVGGKIWWTKHLCVHWQEWLHRTVCDVCYWQPQQTEQHYPWIWRQIDNHQSPDFVRAAMIYNSKNLPSHLPNYSRLLEFRIGGRETNIAILFVFGNCHKYFKFK